MRQSLRSLEALSKVVKHTSSVELSEARKDIEKLECEKQLQTLMVEALKTRGFVKVLRLLEKAEHSCLVTNSLTAATHLDAKVHHAG